MKAKIVIIYEVFGQDEYSREEIKIDKFSEEEAYKVYDAWKEKHVNFVVSFYAVVDLVGDL